MVQQSESTNPWAAEQVQRAERALRERERQPMFFFDGDFRTWEQVVQRARLNAVVAAGLATRSLFTA
tara:strand:+ start:97 stop:297 length:201 start_codon:yes stop_codon:yes gene_type:complete